MRRIRLTLVALCLATVAALWWIRWYYPPLKDPPPVDRTLIDRTSTNWTPEERAQMAAEAMETLRKSQSNRHDLEHQ